MLGGFEENEVVRVVVELVLLVEVLVLLVEVVVMVVVVVVTQLLKVGIGDNVEVQEGSVT
jgi:hypothetical protein